MADTDYRSKLKLLNEQELEFLRLRCTGEKVESIFQKLHRAGGNRYDFQRNIFRKLGAKDKFDAGDYWDEHGRDICMALKTPPATQPPKWEPPKRELPVAPQPRPRRNPLLYATSAAFLLCLCLGVAGVAAWQLLDIPGLLGVGQATQVVNLPEPVVEVPTQLPAPVDQPTPIVVVVTATSPVSEILRTALPTFPVAPTDIPAPTATEDVNTPAGTILEVGDVWKQDGVSLWLTKVEPIIISGDPTLILSFDVANYTGQDISVAFDLRNVTLETNLGTIFETEGTLEHGLVWESNIPNGSRQSVHFFSSPEILFVGDYLSPTVTEVLVTVRDWGRIKEAVWKIDIAH